MFTFFCICLQNVSRPFSRRKGVFHVPQKRAEILRYSIVYDAEDLTQFFSEVNIVEENGIQYLKALFKGKKVVCERVLKLDAERYQKGDLPLANLLSKYCSYIAASNRGM